MKVGSDKTKIAKFTNEYNDVKYEVEHGERRQEKLAERRGPAGQEEMNEADSDPERE